MIRTSISSKVGAVRNSGGSPEKFASLLGNCELPAFCRGDKIVIQGVMANTFVGSAFSIGVHWVIIRNKKR
jgi:hypothetical protein